MKRHPAQKIVFAIALFCYTAALAFAVAAWLYQGNAPDDPMRASLMASVVFFIGCGVVLQVIGNARLTGIMSGRHHEDGDPPG